MLKLIYPSLRSNMKMTTLPTLCNYGKTRMPYLLRVVVKRTLTTQTECDHFISISLMVKRRNWGDFHPNFFFLCLEMCQKVVRVDTEHITLLLLFDIGRGGSRIPRRRGANPRGVPTYDFAKFCEKLHEIEKILGHGGGACRAHPA